MSVQRVCQGIINARAGRWRKERKDRRKGWVGIMKQKGYHHNITGHQE